MAGSKLSLCFLAIFLAAVAFSSVAEASPVPADEVEITLDANDEEGRSLGSFLKGIGKVIRKGVSKVAEKGTIFLKENGKKMILQAVNSMSGGEEKKEE